MSTGPHTPPPPPTPGRLLMNLRKIAEEIAARHAAAKGRAQVAGSYGRHAEPLTSDARTAIYRAQIGRNRLTPRQRRRRDHKENRAYREFLAA